MLFHQVNERVLSLYLICIRGFSILLLFYAPTWRFFFSSNLFDHKVKSTILIGAGKLELVLMYCGIVVLMNGWRWELSKFAPQPLFIYLFLTLKLDWIEILKINLKHGAKPLSGSQPAICSPSTLVLITGCLEASLLTSRLPSFSYIPLSLSLSFPLFVYHIKVDLCRLHLAELGGVGEIQQLTGSEGGRDGEEKERRVWGWRNE